MMWRAKRPYWIGVAVLMIAVLGWSLYAYFSSKSAFESPLLESEREKNQAAIAEAQNNQRVWSGLGNTYAKDKETVDSFLRLAEDRSIWPAITLDLLGTLPQSRGGRQGGTPGQRPIVITSIASEYSSRLTAAVAAAPTPTPGMMGGGGAGGGWGLNDDPMGGGMGGGNFGGPGPMPQNVPPMPGAPNPGGPPPGESDRGFNVTITGYVVPPTQGSDPPGYTVVHGYETALAERAPEKTGDKPYFIKGSGYTGEEIRTPPPGAQPGSSLVIWGNAKGPFWDVFATDVAGIKIEERVGPNGVIETPAINTLGSVDMFAPPTPTGPKMLYGSFVFTLKLKVYIKDHKPVAAVP
jgi:hypothetical protein